VAIGIVAIDSGAVSGDGTRRLREDLGDNLLPVLTWLLAGAVATAGRRGPHLVVASGWVGAKPGVLGQGLAPRSMPAGLSRLNRRGLPRARLTPKL
jgi:hypothetical protein